VYDVACLQKDADKERMGAEARSCEYYRMTTGFKSKVYALGESVRGKWEVRSVRWFAATILGVT
jgi:hypothetical protein